MRTRTALTLGVLSTAGAVGTYLFNRPKLRKQMLESESPQEAMDMFTAQVEKDAMDIAGSVKKAAVHNWLSTELRLTGRRIGKHLSKGAEHAKKDVKSMKHEAKAMKSEAAHSAKRMKQKAKETVEQVKSDATAKVAA